MPLLSLPSEIIVLIFDFIPHTCFRQDPSLLSVSKAWYTYAHAASLQHLRLTSKSLPRFPPDDEDISDFIQDHTSSLKLKLYGLIDYATPIKGQLEDFTFAVARLRKLKRFGFVACYCSAPWEDTLSTYGIEDEERFPLDYLRVESVYSLVLSLPHTVTTLKLDTIGSALMTGHEGPRTNANPRNGQHICKMFKNMPALRVLKVRMDLVCGKVFRGQHLKKIIVSLRSRDKDGNKLMRVCTGCKRLGLDVEGSFERRLYAAGREEVLAGGVGAKECVILGQWQVGGLYEVDCRTEIVKTYSDSGGRAWGISSDNYESMRWKDFRL